MKNTLILLILSFVISCKDQVGSGSNNIESIDSGPEIPNITNCSKEDTEAPVHNTTITLGNDSSRLAAPTVSFTAADDNCELSHYEIAIGTTLGGQEVLAFSNIGNVTSYQQKGLDLEYDKDYYFSIRAVDEQGNTSSNINSSAWQIFTPKSLTNLVLWLDASDLNSVSDLEGDQPGDANFSSEISTWSDVSNSNAIHNFTADALNLPSWDFFENAISFNGSNQFFATPDHIDINLSIVEQRTITLAIKTGDEINSRQLIFEEGGTVRGLNIYIEDGDLHCGFWNNTNDGDDTQPYIEVSSSLSINTKYVIQYVLNYSNFNGANGVDGSVECFVNSSSLGSVATTSRLHPHSGDIGLGAVNQHTVYNSGSSSAGNADHFRGIIYELLMYNNAHSDNDLNRLNEVISSKWNI